MIEIKPREHRKNYTVTESKNYTVAESDENHGRWQSLNYSEQAMKKISLCRSCEFSKYFNPDAFEYPDEMCGTAYDGTSIREAYRDDTGCGVVITKCASYKFDSSYYYEYMHSDIWRVTRNRSIEKAGYKCRLCGSAKNIVVHHIRYDNIGVEPDDDLLVVCRKCHNELHQDD